MIDLSYSMMCLNPNCYQVIFISFYLVTTFQVMVFLKISTQMNYQQRNRYYLISSSFLLLFLMKIYFIQLVKQFFFDYLTVNRNFFYELSLSIFQLQFTKAFYFSLFVLMKPMSLKQMINFVILKFIQYLEMEQFQQL